MRELEEACEGRLVSRGEGGDGWSGLSAVSALSRYFTYWSK